MYFPLKFVPKESYHEAPRNFGARRSGGKRKHAGCDLYAPVGTAVFSVGPGVVLAAYPFYLSTWAVEVDHGDFVVRYGEVHHNLAPGIRKGAKVEAGTLIGLVGALKGLKMSMLHFEMYSGKAKGPLTSKSQAPYMRRSDLMDPTPWLDSALVISGRFDNPKMPFQVIGRAGFLAFA
jgi:murein DD-endopeptidase MepM/ murein hydrolase activator NlpD